MRYHFRISTVISSSVNDCTCDLCCSLELLDVNVDRWWQAIGQNLEQRDWCPLMRSAVLNPRHAQHLSHFT